MSSAGEKLSDLLAMGPRGRVPPPLSAAGRDGDAPLAPSTVESKPPPSPAAKPAPKPEAVAEQDDPGIAKLRSAYDKAEAALASPLPELPKPGPRPQVRDFDRPADYDGALVEWAALEGSQKGAIEAEKKRREHDAAAAADALATAQLDRGRAAFADFDVVALDEKLPVTLDMASVILRDRRGPTLAYHLGKNPKEAERIAKLPAIDQVAELGKLAARLPGSAPKPKAPAPKAPHELPMDEYAKQARFITKGRTT